MNEFRHIGQKAEGQCVRFFKRPFETLLELWFQQIQINLCGNDEMQQLPVHFHQEGNRPRTVTGTKLLDCICQIAIGQMTTKEDTKIVTLNVTRTSAVACFRSFSLHFLDNPSINTFTARHQKILSWTTVNHAGILWFFEGYWFLDPKNCTPHGDYSPHVSGCAGGRGAIPNPKCIASAVGTDTGSSLQTSFFFGPNFFWADTCKLMLNGKHQLDKKKCALPILSNTTLISQPSETNTSRQVALRTYPVQKISRWEKNKLNKISSRQKKSDLSVYVGNTGK